MPSEGVLYSVTISTDHGQSLVLTGLNDQGVDNLIENKRKQRIFSAEDSVGNITIIDFAKVTFLQFTKRLY